MCIARDRLSNLPYGKCVRYSWAKLTENVYVIYCRWSAVSIALYGTMYHGTYGHMQIWRVFQTNFTYMYNDQDLFLFVKGSQLGFETADISLSIRSMTKK